MQLIFFNEYSVVISENGQTKSRAGSAKYRSQKNKQIINLYDKEYLQISKLMEKSKRLFE